MPVAANVLALCAHLPTQEFATGHRLVEEGVPTDTIYVLEEGAVEVIRDGVRVVRIDEPGAFLGEISVLLGSAPTADVLAAEPTRVRVLTDAGATVPRDPALTHAIAQLLARRLQAVTAYLVDIKRQYGDGDTHLALMDQVLAQLMTLGPAVVQPGSERADLPDY